MTTPAPLTDDHREAPLWADDVEPQLVPDERLPARTDAVVVGGGYAGLAAAIELSAWEREVVVLERHHLGWGASTRNAGMVLPELHHPPDELERLHGPLGLRLQAAVDEAFDWTESLLERFDIDARYERTGLLRLADDHAAAARLRDLVDQLRARGQAAAYLGRDALGDEIGSTRFVAGARIDRAGALHPGRLHGGLVRLAVGAGVHLHPRTAALRIDRSGGGFEVRTSAGRVRCETVIVAVNAHHDRLVPALRAAQLGIASFAIATEPLPPALAAELLPRGRVAYDSRTLVSYWRLTPDRRVLFGGRDDLDPTSVAEARDRLRSRMLGVFPQLEDVAIARSWGGTVAITRDRLPHAGQADGVWYVTGGNGTGVSIMPWLAARLAGSLCGGERPPFLDLPLPTFPVPALAPLYLPLAGRWFRWRDAAT